MIWNLIGAAAIIGWYLVASTLLFLGLKILGLFRIAEHLERTGLDAPYHSEPAYVFSSKPPSKDYIAKPSVIGLIDLVLMKILSYLLIISSRCCEPKKFEDCSSTSNNRQ